MFQLKISDLSFCQVLTEKDIEVQGGLTLTDLGINSEVKPLLKRLIPSLSEISDVPLEVKPLASEDGSTVEKLENPSAGLSGYRVTSQDGRAKLSFLTGNNFKLASSSIQSS